MKLKRILAGTLAALSLFTLASCGGIGKAELYGTDDPFEERLKESLEETKKDAKEEKGSFSYSIKFKNGWDKDWKEDYCKDIREQTVKKFEKEMKEDDITLMTLTIKGSAKEDRDSDKIKYEWVFYLGVNKDKEVIFPAGGELDIDGELQSLDSYGAQSYLQNLISRSAARNPF